jgi:hypothetical protein
MRLAMTIVLAVVLSATIAVAGGKEKGKEHEGVQPVPGLVALLDCTDAIPISCGAIVQGTNVGAPQNVDYYSCSAWQESGGEVVYELTLDGPDYWIVAAMLTPEGCDLDVFFLGSCDENDCIAYGDATAVANDIGPGTYYIVVDGYMGAECDFTLEIDCVEVPPPCCPFPYVCYLVDFNPCEPDYVTLPCGGAAVWEWGAPVGIPDVACDDVPVTNVLGTVLSGDYYTYSGEIAMVGPFDITEECWCLELCHYYDTEASFDGGNVKVSTDEGVNWTLVEPQRGYDRETNAAPMCVPEEPAFSGHEHNQAFQRDCFDLMNFMGQTIWVGFHFGSDGSVQYPGWYIKWIKIGSHQITPVEETSWGTIKAMYR